MLHGSMSGMMSYLYVIKTVKSDTAIGHNACNSKHANAFHHAAGVPTVPALIYRQAILHVMSCQ